MVAGAGRGVLAPLALGFFQLLLLAGQRLAFLVQLRQQQLFFLLEAGVGLLEARGGIQDPARLRFGHRMVGQVEDRDHAGARTGDALDALNRWGDPDPVQQRGFGPVLRGLPVLDRHVDVGALGGVPRGHRGWVAVELDVDELPGREGRGVCRQGGHGDRTAGIVGGQGHAGFRHVSGLDGAGCRQQLAACAGGRIDQHQVGACRGVVVAGQQQAARPAGVVVHGRRAALGRQCGDLAGPRINRFHALATGQQPPVQGGQRNGHGPFRDLHVEIRGVLAVGRVLHDHAGLVFVGKIVVIDEEAALVVHDHVAAPVGLALEGGVCLAAVHPPALQVDQAESIGGRVGGHGAFACAIDGQGMRGKGQGDLAFECHALGIQRYQGAGCRAARVFHIATEGSVERVAHQPHLVETPDRTMFFVCIRPVQAKVSVVGLPFRVEMLDFFAALGCPECLAGRLAGKGRGRRVGSGKGRGKKGAEMGRPHGCRFPDMAVVLRKYYHPFFRTPALARVPDAFVPAPAPPGALSFPGRLRSGLRVVPLPHE